MRCGNCKGSHSTADEVRACYNARSKVDVTTAYAERQYDAAVQKAERADDVRAYASKPDAVLFASDDDEAAAAARTMDGMSSSGEVVSGPVKSRWPASDAQIRYVLGLQDERRLPDNWIVKDEETLRSMDRDEVSADITMLKVLPKSEGSASKPKWTMPAGRYCVPLPTGLVFLQVDRPTEGRWKGYVFIKRLIGSPGDYRQEQIGSASLRNMHLTEIERDPKAASLRFGLESGTCGVCSSPLTNEDSLKRGIGPVCAKKTGW